MVCGLLLISYFSFLTSHSSFLIPMPLLILLYIGLFLITRLFHITTFPLFIDETAHIYLAHVTLNGDIFAGLRETHKQIYLWFVALALLGGADPILTARLVSVGAGLGNGALCYKIGQTLFPQRYVGVIAALLYLSSPFAMLYDRLALADSMQTMLMGLSLLASYHLWREATPKWAFITGAAFALATFNKGYAALFYPMPFLFWLCLGCSLNRRQVVKLVTITYSTASLAWGVLLGLGWHIYLRDLSTKSIAHSAGSETSQLLTAVPLMASWLMTYLTWPLIVIFLVSLIFIGLSLTESKSLDLRVKSEDLDSVIALTLLVAIYFIIMAVMFAELRSRYLLPLIIPMLLIVAWGIDNLIIWVSQNRNHQQESAILCGQSVKNYGLRSPGLTFLAILFLLLNLPALTVSYALVMTPDLAPLPAEDRHDYITHAQSPQGYDKLAEAISQLAQGHDSLIFLQHSLPSPTEAMLSVYLPQAVRQQMILQPITNLGQLTPHALNQFAAHAPVLTVEKELILAANPQPHLTAQLWPLASFTRSGYTDTIGVYQWLSPQDFVTHWLQQSGDPQPKVGWQSADWPRGEATTPAAMSQALAAAGIEYVFATPALIAQNAGLFAPFITTDGVTLAIKQLPPGWRLAWAYPNIHCEWCLFQLKPPPQATDITFGNTIELEGYQLAITPHETLHITLYWHSLAAMPAPYISFIHLLDAQGQLVAQIDEPPFMGQWPPGLRLADRHELPLPADLPSGKYTIITGLYDPNTLQRLPVQSPQLGAVDNAVSLTVVTVE